MRRTVQSHRCYTPDCPVLHAHAKLQQTHGIIGAVRLIPCIAPWWCMRQCLSLVPPCPPFKWARASSPLTATATLTSRVCVRACVQEDEDVILTALFDLADAYSEFLDASFDVSIFFFLAFFGDSERASAGERRGEERREEKRSEQRER